MTLEIEVLILDSLAALTGGAPGGDILVFMLIAVLLFALVFALRLPSYLIMPFGIAIGFACGQMYPPFMKLMVIYVGYTFGIWLLRKFYGG